MRYSVLDLCPIIEGGDAALAFRNSADLARHTEKWGYHRYWLAEHHNLPGIASAATSVIIAYIGGKTEKIRVGAGGVMLPNHAPLVIAEQFGTLESLYPGRIDLALGRAPGSDQATARALRRHLGSSGDTFPQDLVELMNYFRGGDQRVRAVPGSGLNVPLYLLGSSDFSARLAAELGLPFALSREEHAALAQRTQFAAVGSPETVRHRIEEWLEQTAADEMIAVSQIYDHAARLRSYEIGSRVFQQINATKR